MEYKKSEFAKLLGVSPSIVTRKLKEGVLVEKNGRISISHPKNAAYMKHQLDKQRNEQKKKSTVDASKTAIIGGQEGTADSSETKQKGKKRSGADNDDFVEIDVSTLSRKELEEQLKMIYESDPNMAWTVQRWRKSKIEADKQELSFQKEKNQVFDRQTIQLFIDIIQGLNQTLVELPENIIDEILDLVKSEGDAARNTVSILMRERIISILEYSVTQYEYTTENYPLTH